MMEYEISVIIPVYNSGKTIKKCVESIIYGEYRKIEVILIDDCSTDNSWDICQQLARCHSNIYCYRNDKNQGVSYTRNCGLSHIKGEYVLFVDSDDWVSGVYVKKLLDTAKKYSDALVLCGHHFYDEVWHDKKDYIWREDETAIYGVGQDEYFDLAEKFLIQQLWNKIFHRDVIENNHILFDVHQNMGEDFQFVLEYMEAACIKQCIVINEPLYYYTRLTDNSLMSQFGLKRDGNSFRRQEKLLKLAGKDNEENRKKYEKAVGAAKVNFVYHAVHSIKMTKAEKIDFIETVMRDGKAEMHYKRQLWIAIKERILQRYLLLKSFFLRMQKKITRIKIQKLITKVKREVRTKNVTIISQNCIGGVFYHDLGMKFLSPTINLFINEPDFVRFVQNLKDYIESDLEMSWGEEYPIGILGGDVRIDFMHYQSCEEAKEKWEKRAKRINWDKIVVFSTDRNGFTEEVFGEWKKIRYPKVLFTSNKMFVEEKNTVFYPEYCSNDFVPDLIPKREFYKYGVVQSIINGLSE